MKPLHALRRFRQNGIDPQRPLKSLARWAAWLIACARGMPTIARFDTGGLKMTLVPKLHSFGSTSLFIKRDRYEPELLVLERLIKPGDVTIDIGSSFGVFALFMAHFSGPAGKVHAFEPGQFSFGQLTSNIALNRMEERIIAHHIAASDAPAELGLAHGAGSPVNFSIGWQDVAASERVKAERVAEVIPSGDQARVRFVKIDVEGYEQAALEGTRPILEATHPVIMFEVSAAALRRQGQVPADIYAYLAAYGYRFWRLTKDDRFEPVSMPDEGNIFAAVTDLEAI